MTEACYVHEQETNKEDLDPIFLDHLFDEFIESTASKSDIARLELRNYIEGKGEWNIEIKKDTEEQPTEPAEDNSLPLNVVNNYYLGNILKMIFEEVYALESTSEVSTIRNENLISLLGLEFAGKKTLAQEIKNRYGLSVIQIDELITKKLKDYEALKERAIDISPETQELVELCYSGKQVPNKFILELLKEEVEKNPKSVIVDYPKTYEECVQFTKAFGGVEPNDAQRKSKLISKIE